MKIVIATFAKNQGGAGDFLNQIVTRYNDYLKIYPYIYFSKLGVFGKAIVELQSLLIKIFINCYIAIGKIDHLVIIYPQSMGYGLTAKLLRNAKKIDYWIIDTSFFCIKSYNYHNKKPCLKCLKQYNPFDDCTFFPRKSNHKSYIRFQKQLQQALSKIKFIVQTKGYKQLLYEKFGDKATIEVYKMSYPQLVKLSTENAIVKPTKYDLAFHGNNHPAKGSDYFLELSKEMNELRLYISFHTSNLPHNVVSNKKRWNTGLKMELLQSKIIVCPSLWTVPVEGAVLKSMLLKKPIAIVKIEMSMGETLLPKNSFIPLTGTPQEDVKTLLGFLNQPKELEKIAYNGFQWAKNYVTS